MSAAGLVRVPLAQEADRTLELPVQVLGKVMVVAALVVVPGAGLIGIGIRIRIHAARGSPGGRHVPLLVGQIKFTKVCPVFKLLAWINV